jgi:hypothetical protein
MAGLAGVRSTPLGLASRKETDGGDAAQRFSKVTPCLRNYTRFPPSSIRITPSLAITIAIIVIINILSILFIRRFLVPSLRTFDG